MAGNDRLLERNDLVGALVSVEVRLNPVEEDDRAVSSSTARDQSARVFVNQEGRSTDANLPWASAAGEKATASWNVRRKDS